MSCDVGKATEGLENEQSSFTKLSIASPTSQLILQPFFCLSYITGFSLMSPGEPPMMAWAATQDRNQQTALGVALPFLEVAT